MGFNKIESGFEPETSSESGPKIIPNLSERPGDEVGASSRPAGITRRDFLKTIGAAAAVLAIDHATGGLLRPAEAEAREHSEKPTMLDEMIKNTGADRLLQENAEFRNAASFEQLEALYARPFDDSVKNPRSLPESIAMAHVYLEFLEKNEGTLAGKYPPEKIEKIYQQAGYTVFNAFSKYSNFERNRGAKFDERKINSYVEGFKKSTEIYEKSLKLQKQLGIKSVNEKGKVNKTYNGLAEMSYSLSNLSSLILEKGSSGEMKASAGIRELIKRNIDHLKDVDAAAVYLGSGKFVFPKVESLVGHAEGMLNYHQPSIANPLMQGWLEKQRGGNMMFTSGIIDYLNSAGRNDEKLRQMLLANGVIRKAPDGRYVASPDVPVVLMTSTKSFLHENQHHELSRKPELLKKWVKVWNECPAQTKNALMQRVLSYINFGDQAGRDLLQGNVSSSEVGEAIKKQKNGRGISKRENDLCLCVQEFFAYSTDNDGLFFNPNFETLNGRDDRVSVKAF